MGRRHGRESPKRGFNRAGQASTSPPLRPPAYPFALPRPLVGGAEFAGRSLSRTPAARAPGLRESYHHFSVSEEKMSKKGGHIVATF